LGNYYINELRWLTIGDQVKFLGTEKGTVVELWRRHDVNLPRFSGKTRDRYTDLSAEDWEIVINLAGLIGRPLGILGQFEKRYEWGEYAMRACDALIIIAVQKEDNEKERKYREYREWFAVHDVAWAQDRLGRHETAIQIWKNSLQRAKEQGFKKVEALALYNMSKMALFQDIDNREELDQAEQLLQTSVGLWEELREREWVGHTKRILGLVLHRKGDPEAALDVLQVALDLLTAQDHDDGIIATLADMALVALSLNDPRAAPQFIESAIAKAAKLSAPAPVHAYALWKRAQMAAETDRPSEEVEVWMRASLKIYQATFADYWKREAQKWWDNYVGLADIASQNTQTQRVGALHMKPGRKEGMTQFKYDVFISHASKDNSIVDKIIQDFKREGITYWLDAEQIDFGDNIIPKIEEGLKMSRYVMPCLSQNLIKSGWCRQEYNSILNSELSGNSTRIVIPLKLDNCNDAEIPLLLKDKKRASYSDQAEYEKLLEFLRR
jgi:tetratricopeptide (TPR) repeat protein